MFAGLKHKCQNSGGAEHSIQEKKPTAPQLGKSFRKAVYVMTYDEAVRDTELIRELEAKKERLEAWIESLKDGIKAYLSEQGETSAVLGSHKVSWTEYEMRRFDTRAFREEHKELYKQFEVKSTVKRLTIH